MSQFYCHDCGTKRGWGNLCISANLTGTPYQYPKYIKHTNPTSQYPIISVFDDPNSYWGFAASASAYGFFEQDSQRRINRIWDAGKRVGETIGTSQIPRPDSAVKFVLHDQPHNAHGFPTALSGKIFCADCGCSIYTP